MSGPQTLHDEELLSDGRTTEILSVEADAHKGRVPYLYEPLNEAANEIRLLTILPDEFSAPVRVCLHTTPFVAKKDAMVFEAFSYAWGSQEHMVDLLIGRIGLSTIKITPNLAEALPYLRYQDLPRVMWVDAICVNQQDLQERSSQVRRMADIYSLASRAVVWLGPAADDTALAVACCKEVTDNVIVDWVQQTMSSTPRSQYQHWSDRRMAPRWSPDEETAILNFLSRDWFTRLWIWQEVALAAATLVMCGSHYLSWKDVQDTVFMLYVKPKIPTSRAYGSFMDHLLSLCRRSSTELDIDYLLDCTKYFQCSDPRDKLFALFSLLRSEDRRFIIETDYMKSTSQIYTEFARKYTEVGKHLRLLCSVEMNEGDTSPEIPSWVPDWASPRRTQRLEVFAAHSNSPPSTFFGERGIAQITGCQVGVIGSVEYFGLLKNLSWDESISKPPSIILKAIEGVNLGAYTLQELCQVLCGGQFSELYWPLNYDLVSLRDAEECVQKFWKYRHDESKVHETFAEHVLFRDRLYNGCHARVIFTCSNGTLGLGPPAATLGDLVVAVLGCPNPVVLRPSVNGSGGHLLVGETYCSGIMSGEAFLGPLPQNFEFVQAHGETTNMDYPAYIDRIDDEIHWDDPRLSNVPLPAFWKMEKRNSASSWFWNTETGEATNDDPRMSAEELKKRGIELQVFEIK